MIPYEHKIQYYETDQMKIVHHSNYIRWFEEARCAVLAQIGCGYDTVEARGIVSPVLSVSAEYKSMSRFGETVVIDATVSYYNGFRFNIAYTVRDKETDAVRCIGETKHCFLNTDGKIVNLRRAAPDIHEKMCSLMPEEPNA
ncbi:MAG: acyl-CoA thioesterase [Ruminococcaceae bacterium]|nr:acyl-CoA thioesterase [Oscillospiraceae bacterium]